ncbi:hypothetical protein GA0070609_6567 [Micromonospora echinaurantiaca]|uniref:Uncharacterized protein n=1 Tax=Micromonospora echinaurantiaca TaxID=47857 RepID=A0A1C5KD56_9ACTN|nr:hypothetical protein [Micromonospora echinaurantiaca]SCG80660.1 hypothetical protein GA0070609_6567 [Micromonospora echinaurantiaca]
MSDRFRRLPPRIEPRYETQDVSPPPPLPEVSETVGLTAGGQVADFERFAEAVARDRAVAGPAGGRARRSRHRVLVFLLAVLALGMLAVSVLSWWG